MSIVDLDKFEQKEMMKKRSLFTKSIWDNWLINYTPKLIKKQWVVLKAKL